MKVGKKPVKKYKMSITPDAIMNIILDIRAEDDLLPPDTRSGRC
jgi:hypothetical protein